MEDLRENNKVEMNKILDLIKKIRYTEVDYQRRVNDYCEEDLDLLVKLLEPLNRKLEKKEGT